MNRRYERAKFEAKLKIAAAKEDAFNKKQNSGGKEGPESKSSL